MTSVKVTYLVVRHEFQGVTANEETEYFQGHEGAIKSIQKCEKAESEG